MLEQVLQAMAHPDTPHTGVRNLFTILQPPLAQTLHTPAPPSQTLHTPAPLAQILHTPTFPTPDALTAANSMKNASRWCADAAGKGSS